MIIIFYDASQGKLHICSPQDKTKVVNLNDPDVMDYIPNDDILYVTNGHWLEKRQFADWLSGNMQLHDQPTQVARPEQQWTQQPPTPLQSPPPTQHSRRYYIHPAHNGTVRIEDIKTIREPEGIELNGKWDFRAIDDIGEDVLNESQFARILLAKGKIEVVDENYYQQHKHKFKTTKSPAEQQLDAILVPSGRRAADVAADGGMTGDNVAIPIYVNG